jgi:hypothetical protein
MKKMRILLDLDNTVLFYSKKSGEVKEHPKLKYLLDNYDVILFSGRDDIKDFADKWNVGYIWKGEESEASADYLIDDLCKQWLPMVTVKKGYSSINRFLLDKKRKKKK